MSFFANQALLNIIFGHPFIFVNERGSFCHYVRPFVAVNILVVLRVNMDQFELVFCQKVMFLS